MKIGKATIAVFGLLLLLHSAAALAARPRIVAPGDGQVVTAGQAIVAEVKLPGRHGVAGKGHSSFQAWLDGRSVGSRFLHAGGGRRRALLSSHGLRPGPHDLAVTTGVRAGARTATRRFIVARRADGAVRFSYASGWRSRGRDLLSVRTKTRIWNTSGYPEVYLNGHRVERRLHFAADDRGFHGGLGPEDGLRYGRNRLRVEVLLDDGTFAVDRHAFRVGRGRPLAGAGPDMRGTVGVPVELDASSSRPAPVRRSTVHRSGVATASDSPLVPLQPLEYEWKVVQAPSGAPVKLEEAGTATPILVPEVPGVYTIELIAKQGKVLGPGVDDVTLTASEESNPMGIPVQTITDTGAIQVGNQEPSVRKSPGVKLLVLGASSLLPTQEETFTAHGGGFTSGRKSLLKTVEAVGNNEISILTGQGESIVGGSLSSSQSRELAKAIAKLGGTTASGEGQTPNGATDLVGGEWSVIGHKGLTEGHGVQNFGLGEAGIPAADLPEFPHFPNQGGAPGSLNGYLQQVTSVSRQFVSPEYLALDTKWTKSLAEDLSPNQNTIAVGSNHYASGSIPTGALAMQLLVLNGSDPTQVLDQGTFTLINADCSPYYPGIYAFDEHLHRWANEARSGSGPSGSNLVITQDFGQQPAKCTEPGAPHWPGAVAPDWLQDALPKVHGNGAGWVGSKFPTSRKELLKMWNSASPYGIGTVAGNFGKFAGTTAHDSVANYRRPFYDDETKQMVARNFGGLTLVASTNLYQPTSAFFQGQGEDPEVTGYGKYPELDNGRVTGVLRRNEQSQWELAAAAGGAGWQSKTGPQPLDQAALYEVMFRTPVPWPCSVEHPAPCPSGKVQVEELEHAQKYFLHLVAPESTRANLREAYIENFETHFSFTKVAEAPYPRQPTRFGRFSKSLFELLKHGPGEGAGATASAQESEGPKYQTPPGADYQVEEPWPGLVGELEEVDQVGEGIIAWERFFVSGKQARTLDIESVGRSVVSEVNSVYDKLLKENKEEQIDGAIAADCLYVLSDFIDIGLALSANPEAIPVAAPALGALASMIDVGDDSADVIAGDGAKSGEGTVPNNTEAIRARISELNGDVAKRYEKISLAMTHFGAIFASDPGKLRIAGEKFDPEGAWTISSKSSTRAKMAQAMAATVKTAAYEATLPLAFVQWVISPHKTDYFDPDGPQELPGAVSYRCGDTNHESGDTDKNPWDGSPSAEATWTLESVGWSGGRPINGSSFTNDNSVNFTVRGLKSSLDDMHPDRAEEPNNFPGLQHSGTSAPSWLFKPLFASPGEFDEGTEAGNLGVSKEQIFGLEDWTTRKLQCGGSAG